MKTKYDTVSNKMKTKYDTEISKYYLNLLNCWSEFLSLNKINTEENILETGLPNTAV